MASKFRIDVRQASRDLLIVFGSVLVANALFYLLLVRPRTEEYRELTSENAPRLQALERREEGVRQQEEYLDALTLAETDLDRLRKDVLATRDLRMISVQAELARLADQFSINLDQVRYQNEALEDEGLERFAMVVPLEGGYANLRKFIQAVETSDRFLVIERVALAEGAEGGVLLQLNITLATYFDLPGARKERKPARPAGRRA